MTSAEIAAAKYRSSMSELISASSDNLFVTDGGIETTLVFHDNQELPYFAACDLLFQGSKSTAVLKEAFAVYARLAQEYQVNLLLESPTWRASPDWAKKIGYSDETLAEANVKSIELLESIREEFETPQTQIVLSGCVGPRGDGYVAGDTLMTPEQAQEYHSHQINILAKQSRCDLIGAMTMTNTPEVIGIVRASKSAHIPVVISFTVETDGSLPTGQSLQSAIEEVDAQTDSYPLYYMINCAHSTHFEDTLRPDEAWTHRIQGIRANASCKSHAELEEMTELDAGNPELHGKQCQKLRSKLPNLKVLGGCCGTDHRHIEAICKEVTVKVQ